MIDVVLYPLLAGIVLALAGGPLGSFVIWQRMAYFGESMAHSALLGVAFAVVFHLDIHIMILVVCCTMALLLYVLHKKPGLSINTVLAIMAHTFLATGLVLISLVPDFRLDLDSFLFGDLLAVGKQDFLLMGAIVLAIVIFLLYRWNDLVALVTSEELARVEGVNTARLQLCLMLALAVLVATGIRAAGVLLVISLLVIPAATSRSWVKSPEMMACVASLLGGLAVAGGVLLSATIDTPAGPGIVAVAGFGYFLSQAILLLKRA